MGDPTLKQRRLNMIKKILAAALVALALASCGKQVLSRTGKVIGEVTLESDAGEVPVLVSADGIWKARSLSDWLSVDDSWHKDTYTIIISYGSNRSVEGLSRSLRSGYVVIDTADGAECDTLKIHQRGIEP